MPPSLPLPDFFKFSPRGTHLKGGSLCPSWLDPPPLPRLPSSVVAQTSTKGKRGHRHVSQRSGCAPGQSLAGSTALFLLLSSYFSPFGFILWMAFHCTLFYTVPTQVQRKEKKTCEAPPRLVPSSTEKQGRKTPIYLSALETALACRFCCFSCLICFIRISLQLSLPRSPSIKILYSAHSYWNGHIYGF